MRTKGSHHHFKHPTRMGIVTVPHPKKDIPKGTVGSILRQAGLAVVPLVERWRAAADRGAAAHQAGPLLLAKVVVVPAVVLVAVEIAVAAPAGGATGGTAG